MHPQSRPLKKMAGNVREGCALETARFEEVTCCVPYAVAMLRPSGLLYSGIRWKAIFSRKRNSNFAGAKVKWKRTYGYETKFGGPGGRPFADPQPVKMKSRSARG
jgi:hypothetical protein